MNKEEKMKVVKKCIEMLPDHGSIRVSHVCGDTELNLPQSDRISANYRSIAGILLATTANRYIKEAVTNNNGEVIDYDILLNPTYELGEITKRTSLVQRNVLFITVGISILTLIVQGVNIWINLSNQQRQEDLQKQIYNLAPPTIRIDSVVVHRLASDAVK